MAVDGLRTIYTSPLLELIGLAEEPDLKRELILPDPDTKLDVHVTERLLLDDLRAAYRRSISLSPGATAR